jgi:hypothetical protein
MSELTPERFDQIINLLKDHGIIEPYDFWQFIYAYNQTRLDLATERKAHAETHAELERVKTEYEDMQYEWREHDCSER